MTASAERSLKSFPWPASTNGSRPQWTGESFAVDNAPLGRAILASEGQSGWSDELNRLLDENGNEFHPITKASRSVALEALKCLGDGALVLEVGSSSPGFVRYLARERPDLAIIGSDYLASSAQGFVAGAPVVPFLQLNILEPSIPERCLDGVIMLNVLEHIEHDDKALAHVAKLVRPGGLVHIEVPAGPGLMDYYDAKLCHFRRYKLNDLCSLAEKCGLQVVGSGRIGRWSYLPFWVVKKWHRAFPPEAADVDRRVANLNSSTAVSPVLSALFHLDRLVPIPCGIRCWMTARVLP